MTSHHTFTSLAVAAAVVLVVAVASGAAARQLVGGGRWDDRAPLQTSRLFNIAHRGSNGELPEETAAAYARAIDEGTDFIEADVEATKDGHLVCFHDITLDDVTDVADHPVHARGAVGQRHRILHHRFYAGGAEDAEGEAEMGLPRQVPRRCIPDHHVRRVHRHRAERQEGRGDLPGDEEPRVHEQARRVAPREDVRGQVRRDAQEVRVRRQVHDAGVACQADLRPVLCDDVARPRRGPHRLAPCPPRRRRERLHRGHQPVLRRGHFRRAPRLHVEVRGGLRAVEGHGGAADHGPGGHGARQGHAVHPYTFHNENRFLHFNFRQDPYAEYDYWINDVGVDGLLTDFPASLRRFQEWTANKRD